MVSWPIPASSGSSFNLASLPYGIFSTSHNAEKRVGAAIGDSIIDLRSLESSSSFRAILPGLENGNNGGSIFKCSDLSKFAAFPASKRKQFRQKLIDWLNDGTSPLFQDAALNMAAFVPMKDATMHSPFKIGGFTDFMCSDTHINNCSILAGSSTPPSHYAMPIGYNGCASSVVVESAPVHRPYGIIRDKETNNFAFRPSAMMDYEAELGIFISQPVQAGKMLTADEAEDHIFGFVVLNDWSARDIQFSEMTPLGPFNGKALATSISPWVVGIEALENARCPSSSADLCSGGSAGASHLRHRTAESTWDIECEVSVIRTKSKDEVRLLTTRSNLRDLRWSPGQMIAHVASSGCGLKTGDLLGTGTISSPGDSLNLRTLGCLFELTEAGKVPAGQFEGSELVFLEDGDEVVMTASAAGGAIKLGTLHGQLLAPRDSRTVLEEVNCP
ncbi:putative 2-hydroxyhepta-2,4-diene-1,7-dioate isomerase [Thelonectria olida]|uniref:Fumarylacetoacetase n=1 Tax=Thelonectria olida TaxID=1576542 RepID=A0A9P8W0X1_9HYPO|nr:putative 2-hydroxyhepta-2,4-diene-1,7-dioate isomerase [Thelonectria olida]